MGNIFSVDLSPFLSKCLGCIGVNASYISNLNDNLESLQKALAGLIAAKEDVMTRVVIAEEQQHMKRLDSVQLWLHNVRAAEIEVLELLKVKSQEIEKLCLGGYCSKNCKSSYKFGKKVAKMMKDVDSLKVEGDKFEEVAKMVAEAAVDERYSEPTVGLESVFDTVWSNLGKQEVGIIGLYGPGGVGKPTLLTKINNSLLHTCNFDVVIWVVVSKDLQLGRIQEQIGKKIGIFDEDTWKNKRLEEKKSDIFKILRRKKFLLLLDDIWAKVDFDKVGVPYPTEENSSKVVFTTRSYAVCGQMGAQKKFHVECLGEDDAWKLFEEKIGRNTLNKDTEILELAKAVARECRGLPLALITIGRAMASAETLQEWERAIAILRTSASKFPGMGDEVYPLLKFSYDCLPDQTTRSCLLYCSLYPEDYSISKSDLIDCWIGEGFLNEHESTGGVINEGYYKICSLLHACLLEEVDENHVKMHDVIRDMALWIASEIENEKEKFLVHAGVGLTKAPEVEKWKGVKRMSLMNNEIENLSQTPMCPDLLTLFLGGNEKLKTITSDFFQNMPSLRVLNMHGNYGLSDLPGAVSNLVSIQHLDLSSCAHIKELPKELKGLVNLKSLNLEDTHCLSIIPPGVISNFSMLIVLRMFRCGVAVEPAENSVLYNGGELLVDELVCLKNSTELSITFCSSHALERFLSCRDELKNCTRSLCLFNWEESKWLAVLSLAHMKHLHKIDFGFNKNLEEFWIEGPGHIITECAGFQRLGDISVRCCDKLRDVTWLVFAPNLKKLWISCCQNMEEIICVQKLGEVSEMVEKLNPFAKLEFLQLEYLGNLNSIYPSVLPSLHLEKIRVERCPKLKKLQIDSERAKEGKIVIEGYEDWWKELEWEDEATRNTFLPCFKSLGETARIIDHKVEDET